MTEEEKEAVYQRALRRRRIFLGVTAAVLIGALALLLVRCHVRPFYSEREVREILEERYGVPFTLQRLPEEGRVYRGWSEAWPELECTVRDVWYDGYWDSLLPVWHFPRHAVTDTLRAEAWERHAVPILAEYGLEAGEGDDSDSGTRFPLGSDLNKLAEELAEAIGRIREAPVFSNLLEQGERIGYWRVPVLLTAGEGYEIRGTFGLDTAWTAEAVREELETLEGRLVRWLERG